MCRGIILVTMLALLGVIGANVTARYLFEQGGLNEVGEIPELLFILAMNVIMLVAGAFIDLPAAILLLGPIFVPLAKSIGLDLTQLGIMMVLNLAIGLYTPPVGTTLFISASIARTTIIKTTRELMPFYLMALAVLFAFSYIPALTLK